MQLNNSTRKKRIVLLLLFILAFTSQNFISSLPEGAQQEILASIQYTAEGEDYAITINVNNPANGTIFYGTVNFSFDINKNDNEYVLCNLTIFRDMWNKTTSMQVNSNLSQNFNLPAGNYAWFIFCWNSSSININDSEYGYFEVKLNFNVKTDKTIYRAEDKVNITLQSPQNSNVTLIISLPNNVVNLSYPLIYGPFPYNYTVDNTSLFLHGLYRITSIFEYSAEPIILQTNFSLMGVDITANQTSIRTGDFINFTVKILGSTQPFYYKLEFGDGSSDVGLNEVVKSFIHKYNSAGNYFANLTLVLLDSQNTRFSRIINIGVAIRNNSNANDTSPPTITLISPEQNEVINNTRLNFSYKADDEYGVIDNCTFELYNKTTGSGFGLLLYNETNKSIIKGNTNFIYLKDFSNGSYYWEITCYDNSSNYYSRGRDFHIQLSMPFNNYINQSNTTTEAFSAQTANNNQDTFTPTKESRDAIDDFFTKMENFDIQQKEASDDLRLNSILGDLKKKLLQIDADIFNIKSRRDLDEEGKEKRRQELLQKIEDIRKEIPLNINVLESQEYVKYSTSTDISTVINDYLDSANITLNKKMRNEYIKRTKEIQTQMTVSTKVKHIEIEYISGETRKITLIKRALSITNQSLSDIIEFIPKDVIETADKANFLVEYTVIKQDPLIKINLKNLENKEVVYWIEDLIDLDKVKGIDTILLSDMPSEKKSSLFTGFAIFKNDGKIDIKWLFILLFISILLIGYLSYAFDLGNNLSFRIPVAVNKEARNIAYLASTIIISVKREKFDDALRRYEEVKTNYSKLSKESRNPHLYNKLSLAGEMIDQAYINKTINECLDKINKKEYEKAYSLYEDIKEVYKRMPHKYQKEIFEKCSILFSKLNSKT